VALKVFRFTALIRQENGLFIARCPEVGTEGQGKTREEALADLKEATELFLSTGPIKPGKQNDVQE
jgi:predicted RNase H-like HicB family nuclease